MDPSSSATPNRIAEPHTNAEWVNLVEDLKRRIGATVRVEDHVVPGPAARLAATLDQDPPPLEWGAILPTGWHCLYCLPAHKLEALDVDGLPQCDVPIPTIPLSRRVFGGATQVFVDSLRFGDKVSCETRLTKLMFKASRSGPMVIARVERLYSSSRGPAVIETQDIVHLNPREGASSRPAPISERQAELSHRIVPTLPLLFRFSALTFNTHRIHYDVAYAVETEGQQAPLVQGRLLALLSLELVRRNDPERDIACFEFRSSLPLYANVPLSVCAAEVENGFDTWILNETGHCAQTGKVIVRAGMELG